MDCNLAKILEFIFFTARQQAGHLKHLLAQARIRNPKVSRDEIARLSACHQVGEMPLLLSEWRLRIVIEVSEKTT
jgi:hypothetical protein